MDLSESLRVYGAIMATVGALFGVVKWILAAKIAPLTQQDKSQDEKIAKQEEEIKELKKALLEELKQISKDNFEFRREYENGLNEIKLLLAEKHVTKADFTREMTEVHNRIDMSHDLKIIKESLKQLNS